MYDEGETAPTIEELTFDAQENKQKTNKYFIIYICIELKHYVKSAPSRYK